MKVYAIYICIYKMCHEKDDIQILFFFLLNWLIFSKETIIKIKRLIENDIVK